MNTDRSLERLLNAAAKAPPKPVGAAPLGLETRVLANWQAEQTDEDASLFVFFRRAMLGASLVLVLSAAWSLTRSSAHPAADEAALLDYDIQTSLTP